MKLQYEIDQNAAKKLLKCLENPIHLINTKLRIKMVILGEVDLDVGPAVMDPKWNRTYHLFLIYFVAYHLQIIVVDSSYIWKKR